MGGGVLIRLAAAEDLEELLRFNGMEAEAPQWPESAWTSFVTPPTDPSVSKSLLLLRDAEGRLGGWLAASQVAATAELECVLIAAAARRQGGAQLLLRKWMELAARQGSTEALLEVRRSHVEAQRLYRRTGFREVGRRRQYYQAPVEDAMLMRCTLPPAVTCD